MGRNVAGTGAVTSADQDRVSQADGVIAVIVVVGAFAGLPLTREEPERLTD